MGKKRYLGGTRDKSGQVYFMNVPYSDYAFGNGNFFLCELGAKNEVKENEKKDEVAAKTRKLTEVMHFYSWCLFHFKKGIVLYHYNCWFHICVSL